MERDPLRENRAIIDRADAEMARLFAQRMAAVREIARYKRDQGLPILDAGREQEVLERNLAHIQEEALRGYYLRFLKSTMAVSRAYQRQLTAFDRPAEGQMLSVDLGENSYEIVVERGCIRRTGEYLALRRRAFLVTDDGVPAGYVQAVAEQCGAWEIFRLPRGEQSKSFENFRLMLSRMLACGLSRSDCVIAVGGGMVGDLAGFAAACYMRGVDFYSIPTTLLAQVDASIGGKTAIDLEGIKNAAGAFYQPRRVLIDPDTLSTLPPRQIASGLSEALKMALCLDPEGFSLLEEARSEAHLDEIILRALRAKKGIVERDEREQGLRRVLNFGHTLGHGIESLQGEGGLNHGECVALGMLPMCSGPLRQRLAKALRRLGLPTACALSADAVIRAVLHDKKLTGGQVHAVLAEDVGRYQIQPMTPDALKARYLACFGEEGT